MDNIGRWIINGVVGLLGLVGLFIASRAADTTFYVIGLVLFVFAVGFIFYSIRKYYDDLDYRPRGPNDTEAIH